MATTHTLKQPTVTEIVQFDAEDVAGANAALADFSMFIATTLAGDHFLIKQVPLDATETGFSEIGDGAHIISVPSELLGMSEFQSGIPEVAILSDSQMTDLFSD